MIDQTNLTAKAFPAVEIESQLNKIYTHPALEESPSLKNFLSFIVHETLEGRALYLKEYTIAVNALKKPKTFNPQKSCVVRIHARRLREALQLYYMDTNNVADIVISIPKGQYVPSFEMPAARHQPPCVAKTVALLVNSDLNKHVLAIYPFKYEATNSTQLQLTDNVCLQLATSLSAVNTLSVVAFQATKAIAGEYPNLKAFSDTIKCRYILSGNFQASGDKIRLNVQLTECTTYKQCWGKIFEFRQSNNFGFKIQDDVCRLIVEGIRSFIE